MARRALVTGSAERVADVGGALAQAGFDVERVEDLAALPERCAALGPASIDCYVQLPVEVRTDKATLVERLHDLLAQGLLARFDAAAAVLPTLRPDAAVVLVAGNAVAPGSLPDDHDARFALMGVLAHAIRAEKAPDGVRTALLDPSRSAADIVRVAATGRAAHHADAPEPSEDMEYADWRLAVLSRATSHA